MSEITEMPSKECDATTSAASPCCLFCHTPLTRTFVDLGMSPLCESFVPADRVNEMEAFFPLHVRVCESCFLVQLEVYVQPEDIFTEYAYFSSYSDSWLAHASRYVDMITDRLTLTGASHVVELASNDGYLLQYFVEKGIPVTGIEPAANVAEVAREKGVPTEVMFFGRETATDLANDGRHADLIIGNNVLAQVPDINSFVGGMAILLKPDGVVTLEFPHLMRLVEENQFDTIYHEHFFYFSLITVQRVFEAHGMEVFDVEELTTHGGSLRIYAGHANTHEITDRLRSLQSREETAGLTSMQYYERFDEQVKQTKRQLLQVLIDAKAAGKSIVGYGAPGKGNTLLNYCAIRNDFLDYTCDRNPYKHGRFTPGTHIEIFPPERIEQTRPDYVMILPWNLKDEIMEQLAFIRTWGGRFIVPIPEATIL